MSKLRFFILCAVLIGALLFLQYRLWFESGGLKEMNTLKEMLAQQAVENDKLKKRNDELLSQIQHLTSSEAAAEARARSELGMVKKDEKFYQIVR
jgi:cell division protein FtsB